MIIGIGTDIIEICRVEKAIKNERFILKCFTSVEIEYLKKKPTASYAGLFAAKEATVKALGTGFSKGIRPLDIEIEHNESGQPYLVLNNAALIEANRLGASSYNISISHSQLQAMAVCILE